MVILRDIEKHPANVHYNTAGQLHVGKLFAEAFLNQDGQPSQTGRIGGKKPLEILAMLGAKGEAGAQPAKLGEYRRIFASFSFANFSTSAGVRFTLITPPKMDFEGGVFPERPPARKRAWYHSVTGAPARLSPR